MVDQNPQVFPNNESKKRAFCTQELIGKFRSKQDFVDYFSNQRMKPFSCLTFLYSLALCASGFHDNQRLVETNFCREETPYGNEWSETHKR